MERRLLFVKEKAMLEVKCERCAGIDVSKKFLLVCVMIGLAKEKPAGEVRRFGTNVKELERLRAWLEQTGCTEAVMESTGSYWKPVFNILEGSIKIIFDPSSSDGRSVAGGIRRTSERCQRGSGSGKLRGIRCGSSAES